MRKSSYNHIIFFIVTLPFSISIAYSQTILKGKVIDALSRQALNNVSIADLNGTSRTTSDEYGNFRLKLVNQASTLLFTCVGYKATTSVVTGQADLKIELEKDVVSLTDVVVLQSNSFTRFNTLSKIDLDLKPVKNTQELLRLVPGLFIAQHAGGGKAEQIFLRGFDCDHGTDVQVSVDGLPVNMVSHAHGQGYADAHFIIPETINNVDFGAGPYYTQHGNLNTAGYVSFSSYNNIPASRIQVEAGRYNTLRTLTMIDLLKKNKDRQSAYIAGEFNYTDGPTINKQNFNRFNFFGKYNLALSDRTQFTATASSFKSKWDASGQVPGRAVNSGLISRFGSIDPSEGGNTQRHSVNFMMAHTFSNGAVWENQAYYSRYKFDLYSNFSFYLRDPVNGDEINQGENRNILGYFSRISQQYTFNAWSLKSTYGAGLRYDVTKDSKLAHVARRQFLEYIQRGNIKEANGHGFMQQEASLGRWVIDAGVRLDYFYFNYFSKLSAVQNPSQFKAIVSPKVNIQYTLNPMVQLFVKSGKGFHSNDTRVVTANQGKDILPAAYGTDVGVILKPDKRLLLTMAAWYLHLNQEFIYVGDEGNIEPGGKTRREGIDLIARYQFTKNLFGYVNLNVTRPRAIGAVKEENYIPLAPVFTSTGGLFYKSIKGFNGSITFRYIKDRPANETNTIIAKGYFLMDASINYTIQTFEIGLAVENMLNVKWNEAQFATASRLYNEPAAITELNYTPGTPLFARLKIAVFF